jgi:penicillin-insensitive murein endopeptidase
MEQKEPTPGSRAILPVALCAALLRVFAAEGSDARTPSPPAALAIALPEAGEVPVPGGRPPDAAVLAVVARQDPVALGPLSIGTPDAGLLLNPTPFPEGSLWTVRSPSESWATDETIAFIVDAIEAVEARHPGSPRVVIGALSSPAGGRLGRHRSHQTGRDADVGFYYRRGEVDSFLAARKKDLDLARIWTLVRALVTETDLERIFLDRSLISQLYAEAVAEGEDRAWLDDVFGRTDEKGIIQHVRRHKDHMHVRFFNRRAQEYGRIAYPTLVETGSAPPPVVTHRVRPGETLGSLARRYGTTVTAIRAANGLRNTMLRAGRGYTIPIRRLPPDEGPVVVPVRRLPPETATQAVARTLGGASDDEATASERR